MAEIHLFKRSLITTPEFVCPGAHSIKPEVFAAPECTHEHSDQNYLQLKVSTLIYPCLSKGLILKNIKKQLTEYENVEVPIMQLTQYSYFFIYLILIITVPSEGQIKKVHPHIPSLSKLIG